MTLSSSGQPEVSWRDQMLAQVRSEEIARSTDALLSLTFNEPDRLWLEQFLLGMIDTSPEPQVRALAVICLGHVARLHRAITRASVEKLNELRNDAELRSRALNAIEDIEVFAAPNGDGTQ